LLRCTPQHLPFQKIISEQCRISPATVLNAGEDSFGNILHSGHISEPHTSFAFCSEGEISLESYRICEELNPVFLYPSDFTRSSGRVEQLFQSIDLGGAQAVAEKVLRIGAKLHETFVYVSGSTNITTTAAEALELGRGVCQDYAHIMIALCRRAGIATRYVAGFLEGENYTHAWVEFFEGGIWLPFDPTHNRLFDEGYIKLANGRDYADCPIERGVFTGAAQQTFDINLSVEGVEQ
jgi:transglutaminase-like putative cysteine protease